MGLSMGTDLCLYGSILRLALHLSQYIALSIGLIGLAKAQLCAVRIGL